MYELLVHKTVVIILEQLHNKPTVLEIFEFILLSIYDLFLEIFLLLITVVVELTVGLQDLCAEINWCLLLH